MRVAASGAGLGKTAFAHSFSLRLKRKTAKKKGQEGSAALTCAARRAQGVHITALNNIGRHLHAVCVQNIISLLSVLHTFVPSLSWQRIIFHSLRKLQYGGERPPPLVAAVFRTHTHLPSPSRHPQAQSAGSQRAALPATALMDKTHTKCLCN